jgi:hypothetical protein
MDDFLLQKIYNYLLRDLFTNEFLIIKYTIKALSQVNRKFAKNFDPNILRKYLTKHMSDISFWPYQRSISYDMLQPVRHDLDMINYVIRWKSCVDCKNTLIDLLINSNKIVNPLAQTIFFKENFKYLFCQYHYNDMFLRGKLEFWNRVVFELMPEPISKQQFPLVAKMQIIVDKCPRWC